MLARHAIAVDPLEASDPLVAGTCCNPAAHPLLWRLEDALQGKATDVRALSRALGGLGHTSVLDRAAREWGRSRALTHEAAHGLHMQCSCQAHGDCSLPLPGAALGPSEALCSSARLAAYGGELQATQRPLGGVQTLQQCWQPCGPWHCFLDHACFTSACRSIDPIPSPFHH